MYEKRRRQEQQELVLVPQIAATLSKWWRNNALAQCYQLLGISIVARGKYLKLSRSGKYLIGVDKIC